MEEEPTALVLCLHSDTVIPREHLYSAIFQHCFCILNYNRAPETSSPQLRRGSDRDCALAPSYSRALGWEQPLPRSGSASTESIDENSLAGGPTSGKRVLGNTERSFVTKGANFKPGKLTFPKLTVTASSLLKNLPKYRSADTKHIPKCEMPKENHGQKTLCAATLDHVISLTRGFPHGGPSH